MSTCVPHQPSTWPVDADGHESNLCEVCGTPTRYGSRHTQCAPGWVEPVAETPNELELLREVHEAARQFLRYHGIDKERQDAALVRMVNATEAVKDYDGNAP